MTTAVYRRSVRIVELYSKGSAYQIWCPEINKEKNKDWTADKRVHGDENPSPRVDRDGKTITSQIKEFMRSRKSRRRAEQKREREIDR